MSTMNLVKKSLKWLINKLGYEIVQYDSIPPLNLPDLTSDDIDIISYVQPYTMTSPERIYALINSVKYVIMNNIPGDIVECGVWKGGSILAAAKTLININCLNRDIYLFDTFEGMPKPSDTDIDYKKQKAMELFDQLKIGEDSSDLYYASLESVKKVVFSSGYDKDRFHFVKGKVEDTIPDRAPKLISILRLDTDWYESTRHELIHLFPRIVKGGIIIIDDYGHWEGSRKATDNYIRENNICLLLNRIDYTGRIGVKIY